MIARTVITMVGLLALAGFSSTAAWAADAEAGKAVYAKKCRTCHGAEGQGNPGMAKVLKVEIKHLGSKEVQDKSDDALKKDIKEGTGKMKPVTGLTDTDVDNVVAFVRTIKQ